MTRWALPALALLGLADSTYLAGTHWRGEAPPCGSYGGCAVVNNSPYAEVYGVPVAAFGALLFAAVLALGLWRALSADPATSGASVALYTLLLSATTFMIYLTGVEVLVLGSVCYWCLGLALITFVSLGIAFQAVRNPRLRAVAGYGRRG